MTFVDLSRNNATITGGTIDGINSLGVVNNIDGLLRTTFNNQSSGLNARTDFVQQIGNSTARSTILGIRQIAGTDTAFLDSRGNLPFEQRFTYAENNYLYYRRSAANAITMRIGGEAGCEVGYNGDPVANYKNVFGAESGKHTALFRSVAGSSSVAQFWNSANSAIFGIFPTYLQAAVPFYLPSYTLVTLPSATLSAAGIVYCSNLTGGAEFVFSDGTNWRRMSDRTIAN